MSKLKYSAYGKSDIGCIRKKNDDAYMVDDQKAIYAVADGLGGLPGGDIASQAAIVALGQALSDNASQLVDFSRIFREITKIVNNAGESLSELGIATTLTGGQIIEDTLVVGHVGDSGLIIFTPEGWTKLTPDQTMAQDMRDQMEPGEEKYIPEFYNHVLTSCIGQTKSLDVQSYLYPLKPGMRILFYTDGVSKTLNVAELHKLIYKMETPGDFVDKILKKANERGGPDNVTAVALWVDAAEV